MGARRLLDRPLWAHALALALILVALAPLMRLGLPWTSDEGAYGLQVEALEDGRWDYEYRAADLDPEGRWFPIHNTERSDRGWFAYAKHPAWPLLLRGSTAVLGTVPGLYVWSLAGAVLAAVAAWVVAAELGAGERTRRAAFWLAAAGPVFVNAYVVWAHAASAALAGLALAAGLRAYRLGPTVPRLGALAACVAAGVLVRAENLLFAVALALAVLGVGAAARRVRVAAVVAAVPVVVAGATTVAEAAWYRSIVGPVTSTLQVRGDGASYVEGRVRGASHVLLEGASAGTAAVVMLAALVVVAGLAWHVGRRGPATGTALLGGAAAVALLFSLRMADVTGEPVTGLLIAWPAVVVALAAVPARRTSPALRLTAATTVLFVLAVLATQYPEGGGSEWGGRFLSPALPALAALAALGGRELLRRLPAPQRRPAVAGLALLALVPVVAGVVMSRHQRGNADRVIAAVVAGAGDRAEVVVTTYPYLPRATWEHDRDLRWMLAEDEADVPALLAALRDRGVDSVAFVGPRSAHLEGSGYEVAQQVGDAREWGAEARMVVLEQTRVRHSSRR